MSDNPNDNLESSFGAKPSEGLIRHKHFFLLLEATRKELPDSKRDPENTSVKSYDSKPAFKAQKFLQHFRFLLKQRPKTLLSRRSWDGLEIKKHSQRPRGLTKYTLKCNLNYVYYLLLFYII